MNCSLDYVVALGSGRLLSRRLGSVADGLSIWGYTRYREDGVVRAAVDVATWLHAKLVGRPV